METARGAPPSDALTKSTVATIDLRQLSANGLHFPSPELFSETDGHQPETMSDVARRIGFLVLGCAVFGVSVMLFITVPGVETVC